MRLKEIEWISLDTEKRCITHKKPTLKEMQEFVGGYIEPIRVKVNGYSYTIVVNEEGLLMNLPINEYDSRVAGFMLVGNVILMKGFRI